MNEQKPEEFSPKPINYDEIDFRVFNIGDTLPNGMKISQIISQYKNFLIYYGKPPGKRKKPGIGFEYHDSIITVAPDVLGEFRELASKASCVLSKSNRRHVINLLGAALTSAFVSEEKNDYKPEFAIARNFIERKSRDRARTIYLLNCLLASTFLITILLIGILLSHEEAFQLNSILLGGIAGVSGATISVLQRGRSIVIDPFGSPAHLAFEACVRMILGAVFGSIVVIASLSNLAFGIIDDNVFGLFLLAIAGGFSERLVPELIERVSKNAREFDKNP